MRRFCHLLLILFLCPIKAETDDVCGFHDLSLPIQSILCGVEKGLLTVTLKPDKSKECWLGTKFCNDIVKVPSQSEIPTSSSPEESFNPQYKELALKAEKIIPKTWWREGFANDKLLLTKNLEYLPKKLLNTTVKSKGRLESLYRCISSMQFMRQSFHYATHNSTNLHGCKAMEDNGVKIFFKFWHLHYIDLEGEYFLAQDKQTKLWRSKVLGRSNLIRSASYVLQYFNVHYSTTNYCHGLAEYMDCRGALAAAALVLSSQIISEISQSSKVFPETFLSEAFILASLGRGLLHGDFGTIGNQPLTSWKVKPTDFIGLQAAALKLYIDSYGKLYNDQLKRFIPFAFSGDFPVVATKKWRNFSHQVEPVYTSIRNWMYTEGGCLIDFSPYRPLVAFHPVRETMEREKSHFQRRVLIDVGSNGFFASPKYLIDHYSIYLPFTDVVMIEPEPHFSASIPPAYSQRYNITHLPLYAEVATGSQNDIIKLIPTLATKNDFVVVKFDVDSQGGGSTLEWGFLFDLMRNPETAQMIDEIYVELHFHYPLLNEWTHRHSNWEALDTLRFLRDQSFIIHSWP